MTLERYSVSGEEVLDFVFDHASSAVHKDFLSTLAEVVTGPYPGQHDHLGVRLFRGGPGCAVEFLDGIVAYRIIEHEKRVELFHVSILVDGELWGLG